MPGSKSFPFYIFLAAYLITPPGAGWAATAGLADPQQAGDRQCMLALLETGRDELTVGEIRASCAGSTAEPEAPDAPAKPDEGRQKVTGGAGRRLAAERGAASRPFSILAHKPNYLLPAAYNFNGWAPLDAESGPGVPGVSNKDTEVQFQISLKVPLALDLMDGRMDVYGAYTNRSFWQMYNSANSEPFRETNHEPAVWAQFKNQWQLLGFNNVLNAVGFVHQSNGKSGLQSRSWNRIFANLVFEKNDLVLSFKPWIWVSSDKSESDNPDITRFLGRGEFRAAWQHDDHVVSLMLRNQLESGFERGALEVGWSIPVFDYPYLKAYVQYFYGYGESLIDYNRRSNRIGLGISVTDWID